MAELLTSVQMRAVEQAAMDAGDVSGLELMERAGQGVVDAMFSCWPELTERAHAALVLCGPGNNGGDGFVIARVLVAAGWQVRVHLFGDAKALPQDAKANHDRWAAAHPVAPLTPEGVFEGPRPDVIVDAVFGIGLTRPLPDDVAQVLDHGAAQNWKQSHTIRKVAVDCPSGLNLDYGTLPLPLDVLAGEDNDGTWPETINIADLTVTFHAPKLGHYLAQGPGLCRELVVADIGLTTSDPERAMLGLPPDPERVRLVSPTYAGRSLPKSIWPGSAISKQRGMGHKYDHGHVVVFAGGVGRGGAGRLAARTALRSGAGLVTLLCPPAALIENACHLEAVMLRSLKKQQDLCDVADDRVSAFCLGPGMGVSEHTSNRVLEVLARRKAGSAHRDPAVVLDADALSCFADDPEVLFKRTHARTILTPHEGEFARLFPDLSGPARRNMSKVDAVREAAKRAGCIILLKGADTVIAQPDGGASVHASVFGREAPWLATAGAGDVLAGLIAGLAAPHGGSDLFQVAEAAAWLHVEAARGFGPGLIAEDLPEQLPMVFRDLGI
ncbi:MAG: NAD(P)H-hydrate dehydratase [Sulfitobacter sp.]